MEPEVEIRHAALNCAINRLGNTTIAAMPTETILDMARAFELYLNGDDSDNSEEPDEEQTGPDKKSWITKIWPEKSSDTPQQN